ncbi:MAG: DegV family protein [Bacillota bacterium]|nr:DegV family protein [Bacillota bacterium]
MQKVAVLTDSTADIPQDLREEQNINVIPLSVVHEDKSYLDGIDIKSEEFYKLLEATETLPKSSQPSPGDFIKIYERLLESYTEVISIHISSGLSGTLSSALQAKEMLKAKIHVIDSKSISVGTGLQVLEAVKGVAGGLEIEQVLAKVAKIKDNMEVLFTLNTLEYLHKGGRIGKVSSIMSSLLNIKPVIKVEDGAYVPFAKVRSRKNALDKIVASFEEFAQGRKVRNFAVAHGADLDAGLKITEALENLFNMKAAIFTQVGPVIGVHTGPGTVGAAICFED